MDTYVVCSNLPDSRIQLQWTNEASSAHLQRLPAERLPDAAHPLLKAVGRPKAIQSAALRKQMLELTQATREARPT